MIDPKKPNYSNTPVSPQRPMFSYIAAEEAVEPVVTIITAFYNTEAVFHETARSVFQQSLQQWEWLIVNDGTCVAESLAILDAYRQCDPRIRVIDLPTNVGPSAARNTAFRTARAEYIVLLDSDDLLEPTTIEKWLWFLVSYPEYAFAKSYSVGFGALEYLSKKGFRSASELLEENVLTLTSMMRRSVYDAIGGYDEMIRGGMEDWDFWLRCAHAGYWGGIIPEFLDWYRRRTAHHERWTDWDQGAREQRFKQELRRKYPALWSKGFPSLEVHQHRPYEPLPNILSFDNRLIKRHPRLLLLLPWLTMGGADKFNLDLLKLLVEQYDYEVTIATTLRGDHSWMSVYAAYTPDIFALHHFLRLVDYPRFLRYLIESRQIDTVIVSNSYLGYQLLPYLRAYCSGVTFLDYIHMEEENWKNGGYPRASLNHAEQLDLTVVSSEHLKQWMIERGGDAERIEVCTTNIDTDDWNPERYDRVGLRQDVGIGADEAVILYAGRICQQKQPKVFAEVMRELASRGEKFVCLVAGDGPERVWLAQYIRSHHLNCVRMLGSVDNLRMRELMALSDIFFLPSEMEGISLAIYEAMAMSTVPVCADVGGQRELVTSDCGFLVSHDEAEISSYIDSLSRLLRDPHLRKAMGCASRQRVCEHYRLNQMGERMMAFIGRARELTYMQPQPIVPPGLGFEIATQVIEQTRLEQVIEQMWRERQALLTGKPTKENFGRYVMLKFAQRAKVVLRPVYRWAVRNNMSWLIPLRDRLYYIFTRLFHQGAA